MPVAEAPRLASSERDLAQGSDGVLVGFLFFVLNLFFFF